MVRLVWRILWVYGLRPKLLRGGIINVLKIAGFVTESNRNQWAIWCCSNKEDQLKNDAEYEYEGSDEGSALEAQPGEVRVNHTCSEQGSNPSTTAVFIANRSALT